MEGQQRQDGRRGCSRSRKAEEYINKVHMAFAEGHHPRSNNSSPRLEEFARHQN